MKILVSACLLGENCKYNGGNNENAELKALLAGHEIVPVCPEVLGGLPIPRVPSEIVKGIVTNKEGVVVDEAFRHGAAIALAEAKEQGIALAILQSRSPSCGVKEVYDGSFSGRKISGQGVFAASLLQAGIECFDVEDMADIAARLQQLTAAEDGQGSKVPNYRRFSSEPEVADCGCIYG